MDSILKNVGGVYINLFGRNIIQNFKGAYTAVSSDDRQRFAKVVKTWRTNPSGPIFPAVTLGQLEAFLLEPPRPVAVPYASMNAAQPISNPLAPVSGYPIPTLPQSAASDALLQSDTSRLILKQIQDLLAQKQQQIIINPSDALSRTQIPILSQLLQLVSTTSLDYASLQAISQQIQAMLPPAVPTPPVSIPTPPMIPTVTPDILPTGLSSLAAAPTLTGLSALSKVAALPAVTNPATNDLMGNLLKMGLLNQPLPDIISSSVINNGKKGDEPQPVIFIAKITLRNEDIAKKYPNAFSSIYEDRPSQCRQCGIRFLKSAEGKAKMDSHLDYHFRQNRRAKDKARKAISRDWYLSEDNWVAEKDADINEPKAPTFFFNSTEAVNEAAEEPVSSIRLEGDTVEPCTICNETFEKYWDEEEEDWMIRNALRIDGKLYHQTCYRANNTSGTGSDGGGGVVLGKRKADDAEDIKMESGGDISAKRR
ncbi:hypothetical protein HDV05_002674 [Chytridiales sp. JEL 0842]|nr:hypothetical protein HDV05_002674 [Chytridiales sp. JEL 0842]